MATKRKSVKVKEAVAKKTRMYDVDYLKFGFIPTPNDSLRPYCLLCSKSLCNDSMRPAKLEEHLNKCHTDSKDENIDYFKSLKRKFESRKERPLDLLIGKQTDLNTRGLTCSYEISLLIAKNGRSHIDGENMIKPAIESFLRTVQEKTPGSVTREISCLPLSNDSVRRRIDEMADNVQEQLVDKLRQNKFSLALDESTVRDSDALLLAYVRLIWNSQFMEEMLFCESLETTTTAADIFGTLKKKLDDYGIPMQNIMSVAADGAPAMMGRRTGALKLIKDENPEIVTVHCVVHRENLASQSLSPRLDTIMKSVIKVVNLIKAHPKMDRLFHKFCKDMDEENIRLLLYTAVRWLSRGNCLERFIQLYDSIIEFGSQNPRDEFAFLHAEETRTLVSYMADIFGKLNQLNAELQGRNKTLLDCKSKISAFIGKLKFWRSQIGRNIFAQFTHLQEIEVSDDCRLVITDHLNRLITNMSERFEDLINMEFPAWCSQPFLFDCENETALETDGTIIEELLELQNDDTMRPIFVSKGMMMWLDQQVGERFPSLAAMARRILLPFPTTYLVECGFSTVSDILTKKRGCLKITERGDLRLKLTSLEPDIQGIVKDHSAQGSH